LAHDGFAIVTITKTEPKDSGVYKVNASNSFNIIESEAVVNIFPIEEVAVKPTFTRITEYYRQEVDDLVIEVQVRGIPTPKLIWQRDGVELDIEGNPDKFFIMREPEGVYKLCIHDPSPLDGGRFSVQATNAVGKEEIRKVIKFLGKQHYKYLPGIRHADQKKAPEEEATEETNGEAQVVAQEQQPEAPQEEEQLMDKWGNMKPKKEKKLRLREKVFLPPSKEEIEQESLILKQVRNHLEFESDLKNVSATVGSKVKLLCTVSGPNPTLNWFKDDEPIEFNPPKIKNTSNGSFGSITFLAISLDDAGVYKCIATNGVVEVSSECTLNVIPIQDPNWIKPTFTRNIKGAYNFFIFEALVFKLIFFVHRILRSKGQRFDFGSSCSWISQTKVILEQGRLRN
jgi:Immunoglobulin I-set domain